MTKHSLTCNFCGANFDKCTLEENLKAIESCTNCIVDLAMRGKWNGIAYNIMVQLIERHGLETVKYTYEKLKFQET